MPQQMTAGRFVTRCSTFRLYFCTSKYDRIGMDNSMRPVPNMFQDRSLTSMARMVKSRL